MSLKREVKTLSLSNDEAALVIEAGSVYGYTGLTQINRAIAQGHLLLVPNSQGGLHGQIARIEERLDAQGRDLEDLRRQVAGLPPLSPTDLP